MANLINLRLYCIIYFSFSVPMDIHPEGRNTVKILPLTFFNNNGNLFLPLPHLSKRMPEVFFVNNFKPFISFCFHSGLILALLKWLDNIKGVDELTHKRCYRNISLKGGVSG